ncbi:MAG: [Acidaminococcaceae bacterium]|nr:[FeFe] hydrogenase, group A [Acidaminococcaceae bacterium]
MVNIIIDGKNLQVRDDITILQAARENGFSIPTLCYLEGLNEIGACRLCLVEVKGQQRLVSSCNTKVREGMEISTRSEKVRMARRLNVELILSQHNCNCPACPRNGNCQLQRVAAQLGVNMESYPKKFRQEPWDNTFPLIRDETKCIKCMRCIQVCDQIQNMHVWDLVNTGKRTRVGMVQSTCTLCGQCITHCPVDALSARDDTEKIWQALSDPEKIVIVQPAPAVRTAWAEEANVPREMATPEKLAAALRHLGFDYVFDTNFSADLTILEESAELIEHMTHAGKYPVPMFTSCCPGWIRFLKLEYPEMVNNMSTSKSPMSMFSAIAKSYYAQILKVEPEKIVCVAVMPCVAKKYEADVPEVNSIPGGKDTDFVITTRELVRMLKVANVDIAKLKPESFDKPLGEGTGGAVIFGTTGGVMEAAVRNAYYMLTGQNPPNPDNFIKWKWLDRWREADITVAGVTVRIAVTSGLGCARDLVEAIKSGAVHYDFVEVMACPGGCSGGGGQPIHEGEELAWERGNYLRDLDKRSKLRVSYENPYIQELYKNFLDKPLSEKAEHYLHTNQEKWTIN